MGRFLGICFFLVGGIGILLQQWQKQDQHTANLQELYQSLLRLHNAAAKRFLPMSTALEQEKRHCPLWLREYYEHIRCALEQHSHSSVQDLLRGTPAEGLRAHTSSEERMLWLDALAALFSVCSPGDDAGFFAYLEQFDELRKKNYMTKRERQKVTACATAAGLGMLLLLLL